MKIKKQLLLLTCFASLYASGCGQFSKIPDEGVPLNVSTKTLTVSTLNNLCQIEPQYTPVVSIKSVQFMGGSRNATIKNAYKGEIEIQGSRDPERIREALITFDYQESKMSTYIFQGKEGYDEVFYFNKVDFDMTDVPVRFGGIDHIRIYDRKIGREIRLDKGRDYLVFYGREGEAENGVDLRIKFLKKNSLNQSRLDNENYPNGSTSITLAYYAPATEKK